jgi:outer membrane protein
MDLRWLFLSSFIVASIASPRVSAEDSVLVQIAATDWDKAPTDANPSPEQTLTTAEPVPETTPSGEASSKGAEEAPAASSLPGEESLASEAPRSVLDWIELDSAGQEAEEPQTEEDIPGIGLDASEADLDVLYRMLRERRPRETLVLSLEGAVQMALANNQDLLNIAYEPLLAESDLLSAKGEFDPALQGSATYSHASQEAAADIRTFGGVSTIESFRTDTQTSLGGKIPWGTTYTLAVDLGKEETTFNDFIEEWSGDVRIQLTQPLLRGRGKKANCARVRIAGNNVAQAADQVQLTLLNTLAEVVKAYWDLVGAIATVEVREESLANAERLLDMNRKRLSIGTAAAIDVVQAKAGVATRQSDLIAARSAVLDAEDRLKRLLDIQPDGEDVALAPIDQPNLEGVEPDEEESIQTALENRPEIHSAELAVESAETEQHRAANDLLPQLDVSATGLQGGRDHYIRQVYEKTLDQSDSSYSISVQGTVVLGNRTARGAYHRAVLSKRRSALQLEQSKQDIILGVRLAVRAVDTGRILVESNRQARKLQETNLDAEEKRLHLGVTTSYQVLQVQEDLALARTQEVQSMLSLAKALVDLQLAEGVLLSRLGVEFEPPEQKGPIPYWRSLIPVEPKG